LTLFLIKSNFLTENFTFSINGDIFYIIFNPRIPFAMQICLNYFKLEFLDSKLGDFYLGLAHLALEKSFTTKTRRNARMISPAEKLIDN
jgi:hypothetical protein